MRLTRKIGVLVTVPLVATTAFAALAVSVATGEGVRAQRLQALVSLAARAGELAQVLQTERAAAVGLLVAPGAAKSDRVDAFLRAVKATDESASAYHQVRANSAQVQPGAAELLGRLDVQLDHLTALREATQGGSIAASAVAFQYRIVVAATIAYREAMAQAGEAPADVADRIWVSVDLSHAAEALGLQQVAVLRALDLGRLTPAAAQEIAGTRAGFTDAVVAFTALAPSQWRAWWESESTGTDILVAQQMQDAVARAGPGQTLTIDATTWVQAMSTRMDAVHRVEHQADAAIGSTVDGLRTDAFVRAGVESVTVLLTVALAVALAVRLGRPVVRDLRRLGESARDVAYVRLPDLVATLNDPSAPHDLSPAEVAAAAPSVGMAGRDEIAEVAAAFDDVYRAAVVATAEQAQTRLGVARMFVTLARRMQTRVTQMTTQLDAAERNENDTDRLAWLFKMDHLVTLTRRTTDSLLVLGGQGPGRVRAGAIGLHELLRGAASQVEAYQQIALRSVDDTAGVAGHAVDDLVLLLAELMDNAARYSPPQATVVVDARHLHDRVLIQITDHGIGVEPARLQQINQRLAAPAMVDVGTASSMGVPVVGQIAAHYGLLVELRPNGRVGTVAEVTVPATLLRAPTPRPGVQPPTAVAAGVAPQRVRQAPQQAIAAPPQRTPRGPGAPRGGRGWQPTHRGVAHFPRHTGELVLRTGR